MRQSDSYLQYTDWQNVASIIVLLTIVFSGHANAQSQGSEKKLEVRKYGDEPVVIQNLQANGQAIKPSTAFTGGDGWLKGVSFSVHNTSAKTITFMLAELTFYSKSASRSPARFSIPRGIPDRNNVDPTREKDAIAIKPGDSAGITINDALYKNLTNYLQQINWTEEINEAEMSIGMIIFSDDTAWRNGRYLKRDQADPRKWLPIRPVTQLLPEQRQINMMPASYSYLQSSTKSGSYFAFNKLSNNKSATFGCGTYMHSVLHECGINVFYQCYNFHDEFLPGGADAYWALHQNCFSSSWENCSSNSVENTYLGQCFIVEKDITKPKPKAGLSSGNANISSNIRLIW